MVEVAKLLGVELGEEFEVSKEGKFGFAKITCEGCRIRYLSNVSWTPSNNALNKLLTGEYQIKKKPWRAKVGEGFYAPDLIARNNVYCSSAFSYRRFNEFLYHRQRIMGKGKLSFDITRRYRFSAVS